MPERAEHHIDEHDSYGKKVGVLASILAVLLSLFTISAHRAHTETIELQNETNDLWSRYQSKRIREYQLEMNLDLLKALGSVTPAKNKLIKSYVDQRGKYGNELDEIKKDAESTAKRDTLIQKKALYYDFAEGVLEISLIMSSLYFISRKKLFPRMGFLFGLLGALVGVLGLFL